MAGKTLFQISEDMQAFDDLLDNADLDSPEVQAALAKWANELQGNMEEKVDNYAAFIQTLLARSEARKKEAARLASRAKTDENIADKLKDHLKTVLQFRKLKTVDTPRFKVSVAGNGGKIPLECNVKPEDLPAPYRTVITEYRVNGDAIRAELEAGKAVAGCRLLERGTHLRIS